jgi:hypothetical protein
LDQVQVERRLQRFVVAPVDVRQRLVSQVTLMRGTASQMNEGKTNFIK